MHLLVKKSWLYQNARYNNKKIVFESLAHKVDTHIAHLWQQCHNSKSVIFQEKLLEVLKCYNFLWVQRRHNCSPAASFANCVMTLYLLKVHLRAFLSIPITQKCQILSCGTLVANKRYVFLFSLTNQYFSSWFMYNVTTWMYQSLSVMQWCSNFFCPVITVSF